MEGNLGGVILIATHNYVFLVNLTKWTFVCWYGTIYFNLISLLSLRPLGEETLIRVGLLGVRFAVGGVK